MTLFATNSIYIKAYKHLMVQIVRTSKGSDITLMSFRLFFDTWVVATCLVIDNLSDNDMGYRANTKSLEEYCAFIYDRKSHMIQPNTIISLHIWSV